MTAIAQKSATIQQDLAYRVAAMENEFSDIRVLDLGTGDGAGRRPKCQQHKRSLLYDLRGANIQRTPMSFRQNLEAE